MSTEDELCIHEFPPGQCDLCKPKPVRAVVPGNEKPLLGATVIIAKRDGLCPECEEKIIVNVDHIGVVEEGLLKGEWIHYGCGR